MSAKVYADAVRQTPQSEPIIGKDMVKNSAGGYTFKVDDWTRLSRFLILGSEGGSYYASERKLTKDNALAVVRAIREDGPRAVEMIVSVSDAGRAPKNDPALFALALAAKVGDDKTRSLAYKALPKVARIGTHLFHFMEFMKSAGHGFGRGYRTAVQRWYTDKQASALALDLVKYQSRDGWGHRDALRLAHPKPQDETQKILFHWATQGWETIGGDPHPDAAARLVWAMERAKRAEAATEIVDLIRRYRLPREAIPTQWLKEADVWRALLGDESFSMPITALIRNLATMTRVGLIGKDDAESEKLILKILTDQERLQKGRVHPLQMLVALKTYESGKSVRGDATWTPAKEIVGALDDAFYLTFKNVEPTGKRWMLALDVSGSMGSPDIAGMPGVSPRVGSAAMALMTAKTEKDYSIIGFASGAGAVEVKNGRARMAYGGEYVKPLNISPRMQMSGALNAVSNLPFGGTDCSLPMLYAAEKRIPVDTFAVYTDSETWAGQIQPVEALRRYREQMGIPAKLIVVGMAANEFTLADPDDAGMLDVVGFDTAAPQIMADFARA